MRRLAASPSLFLQRALLALLAIAAFLNTLSDRYAFDDVAIVQYNPLVHSLARWRAAFRHDYWYPYWVGGLYRPLDILSFSAQWRLTPGQTAWFHLGNVLLHAAVVLLVFQLCRRFLQPLAAWLAAAWFAVLPTHVEVVAGLVGRAELGSALFALLALLVAIPRADASPSRSSRLLAAVAAALCTLAALGFKETAITTIGLAALLEWATRPQASLRSRLLDWIANPSLVALALASFLYLIIRVHVVGLLVKSVARIENPLAYTSASTRIRTALWIGWQNVAALFWPFHLAPDYSWRQIPLLSSWWTPQFWLSLAALAAILALAATRLRRRNGWMLLLEGRHPATPLAFGILFALLAWSPVSNLFFAIGTIRANRLLYFPSVGVAVALGWAFERAWQHLRPLPARRILALGCALLLGLYSLIDLRENRLWKDNLTLFSMAVRRAPNSAKAHYLLGYVETQMGDFGPAARQYRRALALDPHFARAAAELASALDLSGQNAAALPWYRRAFALQPTADYFQRLVEAELRAGHDSRVLRLARRHPGAVKPPSQLILGIALLRQHRVAEALPILAQAARLMPLRSDAHLNYARALAAAGNPVEAADQLQQARILARAALAASRSPAPPPSVR